MLQKTININPEQDTQIIRRTVELLANDMGTLKKEVKAVKNDVAEIRKIVKRIATNQLR